MFKTIATTIAAAALVLSVAAPAQARPEGWTGNNGISLNGIVANGFSDNGIERATGAFRIDGIVLPATAR